LFLRRGSSARSTPSVVLDPGAMPEATRFSPIQGVPRKFARGASSYEEGMGGLPRTIMASKREVEGQPTLQGMRARQVRNPRVGRTGRGRDHADVDAAPLTCVQPRRLRGRLAVVLADVIVLRKSCDWRSVPIWVDSARG